MIHEAEFKHRFSLKATEDAMRRANGRRNLKALSKALELRAAGSAGLKSRNEAAFLSMLKNLPEPLAGHDRARTQREDAPKEAAWRAAGYEVLRVTDLSEGLSRLRAALEPRPPAGSP